MTLREENSGQPGDGPGAPLPNHNPGGNGGADEINNVTNNPGIVSPGGMSDASTGTNTNGTPRPVSAQANEATVGAGSGHTPDTVALQHMPTQKSIAVWTDVANGIDKNQTVIWQNAVDSLAEAHRCLLYTKEARAFTDRYMKQVISILLEQHPQKIGQMERQCVEESLKCATMIAFEDLRTKVNVTNASATDTTELGNCNITLDVLSMVFSRKKTYYKGAKQGWNSHLSGVPEVRATMITKFRVMRGFATLGAYLSERIATKDFPPLEILHHILIAMTEPISRNINQVHAEAVRKTWDEDNLCVAKAVMEYINNATEEELKRESNDQLNTIRLDLQGIFEKLSISRWRETLVFHEFCRAFALKLITSQSLPLKLFGWDTVSELIHAGEDARPVPRAYIVSGAGSTFTNGRYEYNGDVTEEGFVRHGSDIKYEMEVPEGTIGPNSKGKKLTLFRCTMRSQQKWWFLSEADEDQPGTDKDIDYYQHKSKLHEEKEPPRTGWVTCRNSGTEPAPTLQSVGLMVPPGEESNTLEHQLAKWALTNGVIEFVLGSSIHREIIVRSTPLIKFLAHMCNSDKPEIPSDSMDMDSNQYCLQTSHLKLAWKTCTSKLDSAVSAEVYHLLVVILPSLPKELGIQLIQSIQHSLQETSDGKDYLFEVAEFCSALSNSNQSENGAVIGSMDSAVKTEILKLLWEILTHPKAESLKCYDSLKTFILREISTDIFPQRQSFLKSCEGALRRHLSLDLTEESLALRMVNLTRFILEASTREEAIAMVEANDNGLTLLVFEELTMYIRRRSSPQTLVKKSSSVHNSNNCNHQIALTERLDAIRYIYGLSGKVSLTTKQLDLLWGLCSLPEDRESMMVFLANASMNEAGSQARGNKMYGDSGVGPVTADVAARSKQPLTAAYSDEIRVYAFQSLFCSDGVDWEKAGPRAYSSFQTLFKSLKKMGKTAVTFSEQALNALWRICLDAGNNDVASHAMKDLLIQYSSISAVKRQNAVPNAWAAKSNKEELESIPDEDFSQRILGFFQEIKKGLKTGNALSVQSLERCIRILNAAVGHNIGSDRKNSSAAPLAAIASSNTIMDIVDTVPHGLRGTSCYLMISVLAKRVTQNQYNRSGQRIPHTERFSLQIHPLESLCSIKQKVSVHCKHQQSLIKHISINNRQNLNPEPDTTIASDIPIYKGCELVVLLASNLLGENKTTRDIGPFEKKSGIELGMIFGGDGGEGPSDQFFDTLLDVLEALPQNDDESESKYETSKLVWDLLMAVPTNRGIVDTVRATAQRSFSNELYQHGVDRQKNNEDMMAMDTKRKDEEWQGLIDFKNFERSVYVMQVIDSFLLPGLEILEHANPQIQQQLSKSLFTDTSFFRIGFIESGGFDAVLRFFVSSGSSETKNNKRLRMGNQYALRILKCCFFGSSGFTSNSFDEFTPLPDPTLDDAGKVLMKSITESEALLKSLISMVVLDDSVTDIAIFDVVVLLRCLFISEEGRTQLFAALPDGMPEIFTMKLLLWESHDNSISNINALRVRKTTEELILSTPGLGQIALPWLVKALHHIKVSSDTSAEFFSVLVRMIDGSVRSSSLTAKHLKDLTRGVCMKLANHPRPNIDNCDETPSGVLCGCLRILKVLVQSGESELLNEGASLLLQKHNLITWLIDDSKSSKDSAFINLMTAIFEGFLLTGTSSESAICSDDKSRQLGFDVVATCVKACKGVEAYLLLCKRLSDIINSASPSLRHKWGHNVGIEERSERGMNRSLVIGSKYSGLRNQGCTCYMNSVLQQLFMMPELRKSICSATLPSSLRASGSCILKKGDELVGKHITVSWDNGSSYEAVVIGYDEKTDMHSIRYSLPNLPNTGGQYGNRINPEDIAKQPDELLEEFVLSEGRPGKETGHYELIKKSYVAQLENKASEQDPSENNTESPLNENGIKEAEDERSYRRVLEEIQRTFVYLDKGARGKVFDPRTLVEASGCLKLEFDIWQQNDASEYAMKLLDRLEVPLKRWSHSHFKHLEHTFRLKQTKQKICKECGLTTNREENLMNLDCQIRGKEHIYEALATMCEAEYMEGDNKVYCERCKRKTDTILRTSISFLPDVLILSLKRFDLDYNTFETVKLNSRCAFDQTLNMKKYTLEGVEAMEKANTQSKDSSEMDTEDTANPLTSLPDEDYEYKLAGVLVHHGYAQGGHYYSFIRDRLVEQDESKDKWYRFDDEVVTPFDPSSIETECFGGKVKKETKWPNGQVNTVESDQLANALMLFYEKVKPVKSSEENDEDYPMEESEVPDNKVTQMTTGYEVFHADVEKSNTTHRSNTFLFDLEFQSFLKELLNTSHDSGMTNGSDRMDITPNGKNEVDLSPHQAVLLELSLSFFFDILLHSVEKDTLDDWTEKLTEILLTSPKIARRFIHDLARRTRQVSDNWLKVYATECPQDSSRSAAMKVIGTALKSCLVYPEELEVLVSWSEAWREQLLQIDLEKFDTKLDTSLSTKWSYLEDIDLIDSGKSSSIGIIISFLNELLEVAPRTWRYNAELCCLLADIGSTNERGGQILRDALVKAQIPARLMCLIVRDKAPQLLRIAFPGASASVDVAEALTRSETNLSSVLPQGNNGSGLGSQNNVSSIPSPVDLVEILEALAVIIGVPGARSAPLLFETGEVIKGRAVVDLTRDAINVLTIVFQEFSNDTGLMNHRDVMHYMESCGVEAHNITQQRISNMLMKYGRDIKCENQLTLEGFLAYYRDTSQSNEIQVRSDLYVFGFRPDLSRSSEESRLYLSDEQQGVYDKAESVGIDVVITKRNVKLPELGPFAEAGFSSIHLHLGAYTINTHLAEYLLAFCICENNSNKILVDSMRYLNRAPPSWAGNETAGACTMIFKVLAGIPDSLQDQRVASLMLNPERLHDRSEVGVGLLHVTKELSMGAVRNSQNYNLDYHNLFERYIEIMKDLQKVNSVTEWMKQHQNEWMFIEQFLRPDLNISQQLPGVQLTPDHHLPSDSEPNGELNYSEEDDDDSRFDTTEALAPGVIEVSGAGVASVNGIYQSHGSFDNVAKYVKDAVWNGNQCTFSLFRCRLSDHSRRWYISIVPERIEPGTNKDVDFYLAQATGDHHETPPNIWLTAKENGRGIDPPPSVTYKQEPVISESDADPVDNNERMSGAENLSVDDYGNDENMSYH